MATRTNPPRGYANPAYADAVADGKRVVSLPRSGGSFIVRSIDGTDGHDATGPYPLFACHDWTQLRADLDELSGELVSVTIVTDPFGSWDRATLGDAFPDLAEPYKDHFVVDLCTRTVARHHRRNIARAMRLVTVERVTDFGAFLGDWVRLYDNLVDRHDITGDASFSRESFAAQFAVPGMIAWRAMLGSEVVGATLWYAGESVGYYHLGAYSADGYASGASFALFATALDHLADAGLEEVSLGASAGLRGDPSDGLSRFKQGWSTGTRTVYLCGRVLDQQRYAKLSGSHEAAFFPAYRSPTSRSGNG